MRFLTWLIFGRGKQGKQGKQVPPVLVFILSTLILIGVLKNFKYILTGECRDLNEIIESGEEIKTGEIVSLNVTYIIDYYAEYTSSRKDSFHCLAMLDNGNIISLEVGKETAAANQAERIIDETCKYITGESSKLPIPYKFTGRVNKMKSEAKTYYKTALSLLQYPYENAYELNIDTTETRYVQIIYLALAIFIFLAWGFFAFLEIHSFIYDIKEAKINSLKEKTHVVTEPVLADYSDEYKDIISDSYEDRYNGFEYEPNIIESDNADTEDKPKSKFTLKKLD